MISSSSTTTTTTASTSTSTSTSTSALLAFVLFGLCLKPLRPGGQEPQSPNNT